MRLAVDVINGRGDVKALAHPASVCGTGRALATLRKAWTCCSRSDGRFMERLRRMPNLPICRPIRAKVSSLLRLRTYLRGLFRRLRQAQFYRADLAHFVFLDFAGDRFREILNELHVVWNLVVHDFATAERLEFFGAHRMAGFQFRPDHNLLAIVAVRHSDDVGFGNLRMREQELLDFAREYLFAATADHIFDAACDLDVPLFVHHRHVAAVQPAGGVNRVARGLRVVVVATHDVMAAITDFAVLAAGENFSRNRVNDLLLLMRHDFANRADADFDGVVHLGHVAGGRSLGLAAHNGDLAAVHLRHNALHYFHGTRR